MVDQLVINEKESLKYLSKLILTSIATQAFNDNLVENGNFGGLEVVSQDGLILSITCPDKIIEAMSSLIVMHRKMIGNQPNWLRAGESNNVFEDVSSAMVLYKNYDGTGFENYLRSLESAVRFRKIFDIPSTNIFSSSRLGRYSFEGISLFISILSLDKLVENFPDIIFNHVDSTTVKILAVQLPKILSKNLKNIHVFQKKYEDEYGRFSKEFKSYSRRFISNFILDDLDQDDSAKPVNFEIIIEFNNDETYLNNCIAYFENLKLVHEKYIEINDIQKFILYLDTEEGNKLKQIMGNYLNVNSVGIHDNRVNHTWEFAKIDEYLNELKYYQKQESKPEEYATENPSVIEAKRALDNALEVQAKYTKYLDGLLNTEYNPTQLRELGMMIPHWHVFSMVLFIHAMHSAGIRTIQIEDNMVVKRLKYNKDYNERVVNMKRYFRKACYLLFGSVALYHLDMHPLELHLPEAYIKQKHNVKLLEILDKLKIAT